MLSVFNHKSNCLHDMREFGLILDEILLNQKIQRIPIHKLGNKDGWYLANSGVSDRGNAYMSCVYGSWKTNEKKYYTSWKKDETFSYEERKELQEQLKIIAQQQEQERIKEYDAAGLRALHHYNNSLDTPESEEQEKYLMSKGVKAYTGIKFGHTETNKPCVIVPLMNNEKDIRTLQFLRVDEKRFLKGGEKRGHYFIIGSMEQETKLIYCCEGYATGASIFEATRIPVIIAIDKNNIDPVIGNIRKLYPEHKIIIAADNDLSKAGEVAAKRAATLHNCLVTIPMMINGESTDFNDVHVKLGIEKVKEQLKRNIMEDATRKKIEEAINRLNGEEKFGPCDSFDIEMMPAPIRDYVKLARKTTNAHPIMITMSVLTSLSAFIRTRVYLEEFNTRIYTNIWTLNIAKSGAYKTTAMNMGSCPAMKLREEAYEQIGRLKRHLKFEKNKEKQQELMDEIDRKEKVIPVLPENMTSEVMYKMLGEGKGGALFLSEFAAWLQTHETQQNSSMRAFLTDIYDVPSSIVKSTKTQGTDIMIRPFISICAASAPVWVQKNIKDEDANSGFLARWIMLHIIKPEEEAILDQSSTCVRQLQAQSKEDLFQLMMDILDCVGSYRIFNLSNSAKMFFENTSETNPGINKWIDDFVKKSSNPDELNQFAIRLKVSTKKLAMLIQLFLDPGTNEISLNAMISAFHIIICALKSTQYILDEIIGYNPHEAACNNLYDMIIKCLASNKTTFIERKELCQRASRRKLLRGGIKKIDSLIETLIERGKINIDKSNKNKSKWKYTLGD